MKNILAKKTIKILTGVIFGCFVFLAVFNFSFALNDNEQFAKTTGVINYYGEKKETYPCSNSINKICVMETRYYKNNAGYEVEQVIKKPNDGISGGEISEYFTDKNGQQWHATGNVNSKNEITSLSGFKQGEKVELENGDTGGSFKFTLLQPLPTQDGETLNTDVTLKEYLTWAYKFVLALTGFLAVMMIVIGGVEWVISGASESMRSEAKKHINGAITGLIIALVAYLVLYTINPSLVDFESNWFFKPRNTQTQNNNTGGYTGSW